MKRTIIEPARINRRRLKNGQDQQDELDQPKVKEIMVTAPKIRQIICEIEGTAPYVQNRMSDEEMDRMRKAITDSAQQTNRKKARDLQAAYKGSMHISTEGWHGIPTNAFLQALIQSCTLVGIKMTMAKMAIIGITPHGISDRGLPLVRIHGNPEPYESLVDTQGKPNIAVRAMWKTWGVSGLRIDFDRTVLNKDDVANLVTRAGRQVGIGAGRPRSKKGVGMGWGTFKVTGYASSDE